MIRQVVVALTAYAMRGDEDRIRQAGCDGYLPKPVNVKTLAEQVRAWLVTCGLGD